MPSTRASSILGRLTALSDPTRCRILRVLEQHELTVGELCGSLQLPQSTVSRHLKVLAHEGWVASRGEGTSRYYKSVVDTLDSGARDLWMIVSGQLGTTLGTAADARRADALISKRRARVRLFFENAVESWDEMRAQLVSDRTEVLALLDLLDPAWVVGDLGCGTGHIAEALSPVVGRVIAVDQSGPMLAAARERLASAANVELHEGHLEALPIEDASLDVAILFLVAHFITDPALAMREVRRVLKPGGRLLIADLTSHERAEYVVQLGHVWQGFTQEQITSWLETAGFASFRYRTLASDTGDRAPGLFVATARAQVTSRA